MGTEIIEREERLLALGNESNKQTDEQTPQIVEKVDTSIALLHDPEQIGTELLEGEVVAKKKSLDDLNDKEMRAACGARLKHARLSKGLLMRDVVERMAKIWPNTEHVTRLQSYEAGVRMMSLRTARHLGRALSVSAAWLLCVDDTIGIDDEQLEFMRLYAQAPPTVRDIVARMLRGTAP